MFWSQPLPTCLDWAYSWFCGCQKEQKLKPNTLTVIPTHNTLSSASSGSSQTLKSSIESMTSHGKEVAQQLSLWRKYVANVRRSPTGLTLLLADVAAVLLAACTVVRNGGSGFNKRFALLSAALSLQTFENEAAWARFKRMHYREHRLFAGHCVWAKEGQQASGKLAGERSGRTLRRAIAEASGGIAVPLRDAVWSLN